MMYELTTGDELTTNGDEWHLLRDDPNKFLSSNKWFKTNYSKGIRKLILSFLHPNPSERPDANS
jgi:hypothetical protein